MSEVRTYIVTGAAGGIGGATAKRLLSAGSNVLGVDISQRRLDTFTASCAGLPGKLATYRADISVDDEVGTPQTDVAARLMPMPRMAQACWGLPAGA